MKRPFLIFAALTLLMSGPPASAASAPPPISEEEYQVYTVALQKIRFGERLSNTPSRFVIGRETTSSPTVKVRPSVMTKFLKEGMNVQPESGLVDDFLRKNKIPAVIEPKFGGLEVELVGVRQTVDWRIRINWADFQKEHPSAYGLIQLSRAGFSRKGDVALLRAEVSSVDGQAIYTFVLGRLGGVWQVEHQTIRSAVRR
jgi:hypothetical protein